MLGNSMNYFVQRAASIDSCRIGAKIYYAKCLDALGMFTIPKSVIFSTLFVDLDKEKHVSSAQKKRL